MLEQHQQLAQASGSSGINFNKQEKANAWIRRMRFVMAQATQQNMGGPSANPLTLQSAGLDGAPTGTQLINNAALQQVMSQLQEQSK